MDVPYLKDELIESAALELIEQYCTRFDAPRKPPIPVVEMVDSLLALRFETINLAEELGVHDVLGATWIEEKRIAVDQSLDPAEHPDKEGRYLFTVAHELGHWQLHRPHIVLEKLVPLLFGGKPAPSVVCRDGDRKPIEYQANTFAAYLLMPTAMIRSSWVQRFGSLEPYVAQKELAELRTQGRELRRVQVAREMACEFKVSAQAMQIRLMNMGLVLEKAPPPSLFSQT